MSAPALDLIRRLSYDLMPFGKITNSDWCQQHPPNSNHMDPAFAIFVCLVQFLEAKSHPQHYWTPEVDVQLTRVAS